MRQKQLHPRCSDPEDDRVIVLSHDASPLAAIDSPVDSKGTEIRQSSRTRTPTPMSDFTQIPRRLPPRALIGASTFNKKRMKAKKLMLVPRPPVVVSKQ